MPLCESQRVFDLFLLFVVLAALWTYSCSSGRHFPLGSTCGSELLIEVG
jgi:hypothetical protein